MPELPDIAAYLDALAPRVLGQPLERLRIGNPFIVRTIRPEPGDLAGHLVLRLDRIGKRIVFAFDSDLFAIVHLMIAGRFRWRDRGAAIPGKVGLAAFDFPSGTLLLTEAGSRRQASIHLVEGEEAVRTFDPGGLEVMQADFDQFFGRLIRHNHTLKRALTDPHIFSGIGNAYSDEILHAAQLSPMKLTSSLSREEVQRLFEATAANARGLDGEAPGRGQGGLSRKSHGIPGRDGGARPVWQALSGLRLSRSAHRLCAQRGQLLQPVSDGGAAVVGQGHVPAAQR